MTPTPTDGFGDNDSWTGPDDPRTEGEVREYTIGLRMGYGLGRRYAGDEVLDLWRLAVEVGRAIAC